MVDVTKYTYSKGNQLNADDIVSAPITVQVAAVEETNDAQQPLAIRYDGDNGKPFLPCLTMRKLIAALWGAESDDWVGKSLTLYRDPSIKFGPDTPGGVRISHMSGIEKTVSVQLLEKRGKRRQYTIVPLEVKPPAPTPTTNHTELFKDARDNAEGGAEIMRKWWATKSKDEQAALKTILPELQEIAAKADAPPAD